MIGAETPQPTGETDRIAFVDALRGLALLGILAVNFPGDVESRLDVWLSWLVDTFAARSFYCMFTVLFGVGFALQVRRWGDDSSSAHRLVRRLLFLFLIGAAHSVLVWTGDILTAYSILGLLALPLMWVPKRVGMALVGVLLAYQVVGQPLIWEGMARAKRDAPSAEHQMIALDAAVAAERESGRQQRFKNMTGGSDLAFDVARRWSVFTQRIVGLTDLDELMGTGEGSFGGGEYYSLLGRDLLLLFVVGFMIGRWGLSGRYFSDGRVLKRLTQLGAVSAALGWTMFRAAPGADRLWLYAFKYGLVAMYTGTLALYVTRAGPRALPGLQAVGRTALTNYLLQSVAMTWLFLPYGLALPLEGYASKLAIGVSFFFFVQIPASTWWLRKFRFGPVEWLWRSSTYRGRQPLRRATNLA